MTHAPAEVTLRRGGRDDLGEVNAVIGRAIDTWNLAPRVKRLSIPLYHYQPHDLDHLELMVAEQGSPGAAIIVAVAAWEPADTEQLPAGRTGLLLHGLYVDPAAARRGIGALLLTACGDAARERGFDGVLVKATVDSESYFQKRGLEHLPVVRPERDYARRYWLVVS